MFHLVLSRGTTPHVTLSPRFNAADNVEEIFASMEAVSSRRDQLWLKRACLARDGGRCVITGAYDPEAYLRLAPHIRALHLDCDTEAAHIVPFALGSSVVRPQSLKNKRISTNQLLASRTKRVASGTLYIDIFQESAPSCRLRPNRSMTHQML